MHSLCQRAKYELPFWDANMWNLEPLMVYGLIIIQQNIEVDIPWAFVDQLLAAHGDFDLLQLVQQLQGLQRSLNLFRVSLLVTQN